MNGSGLPHGLDRLLKYCYKSQLHVKGEFDRSLTGDMFCTLDGGGDWGLHEPFHDVSFILIPKGGWGDRHDIKIKNLATIQNFNLDDQPAQADCNQFV